MRIAHISDLHFGAHDRRVTEILISALIELEPDLVLASGDITQDATVEEFVEAADFFKMLPMPVFVIPGNHDLPGIDARRFIRPWKRYRDHIARDLEPELHTDLVDIKGINSARMILPALNWAYGSISQKQCRDIAAFFAGSASPWRVVTVHHPPLNPKEFPLDVTVFNADRLLRTVAETKTDIVLSGHQHHAYVETRVMNGHTTLFVCASTAMSVRIRKQPQGFNLLDFNDKSVRIELRQLTGETFEPLSAVTHTKV
ncbi:metallophosphoesterase [Asticcacaulis sp. AND118]|uniref:metallophosphoesterase family protein n=1 Tax=Asticcacaulis sp. AND118 TaxID=2840468 RepID=UPI001CFFCC20|nr:metallophosphoesterase [Asticcacaulis sp. AND118]UDF03536.1 metallophosphoesterase [Asticcacaulis sp. AND118]